MEPNSAATTVVSVDTEYITGFEKYWKNRASSWQKKPRFSSLHLSLTAKPGLKDALMKNVHLQDCFIL